MSSGEAEVREVLKALSRKIGESQAMLSGQDIGKSLIGILRLSSGAPGIRGVLQDLSRKIGDSQEMLNAQDIGHALLHM